MCFCKADTFAAASSNLAAHSWWFDRASNKRTSIETLSFDRNTDPSTTASTPSLRAISVSDSGLSFTCVTEESETTCNSGMADSSELEFFRHAIGEIFRIRARRKVLKRKHRHGVNPGRGRSVPNTRSSDAGDD